MLLGNYASDSESDSEAGPSRPPPPLPKAAARPTVAGTAAAGKPKRKGPIKITLDLPKTTDDGELNGKTSAVNGNAEDDDTHATDQSPPIKKAKLAGAGSALMVSSALLGMLPAPKRKIAAPAPKAGLSVNKSMATKAAAATAPPVSAASNGADDDDDDDDAGAALMMPTSVKRATGKAATVEPEVDLFGLSSAASSSRPAVPAAAAPKPATITSAPAVADFVPPDPTPADPYPGYYQLPTGAWAAYDPEYYANFFAGAAAGADADPDAHKGDDGRIGKHWDALDEMARGSMVDIDVSAGLAAARAEEERKARMVKPKLPGDDFEYKPIGQVKGLASERHQLSSLLNTAFSQRDELEARIQANKKNMRMASTKYVGAQCGSPAVLKTM